MRNEAVSSFPERRVDLWRGPVTSVEVQGTSGEVWEVLGSLWMALTFHTERSSEKTSGRFWEVHGVSRSLGRSDSLSAPTPSQRAAKMVSKLLAKECLDLFPDPQK